MQRLHGSWLALLGASLLVLFSVSVAMGSDPAASDSRGQSISGFVHSLIFGDQARDEEVTPADESDEDEAEDEATEDEEQNGDVSGADHGACVSEIAQSDEVGGENDNHGGAVSEAARETCWEEESTEAEDADAEESGPHGACVSAVAQSDEVGGPNDNHGGAVSEAARETCDEEANEESTETGFSSEGAVLGRSHGQGDAHGHTP
jgi:hypothetical protein